MLLYNEKFQQLDVNTLKVELKNELDIPVPTKEELEEDLGNYYSEADSLEAANYGLEPMPLTLAANRKGIGRKILQKIKQFICGVLNENSTIDKIIDTILNALAAIIPGGIIIKWIVKKILKFILSFGIGKFCAA
jgi:hypothetical protein